MLLTSCIRNDGVTSLLQSIGELRAVLYVCRAQYSLAQERVHAGPRGVRPRGPQPVAHQLDRINVLCQPRRAFLGGQRIGTHLLLRIFCIALLCACFRSAFAGTEHPFYIRAYAHTHVQDVQTPGPGYYHDTDPWHVAQLHASTRIRRNKDHHPSGSQNLEWVKVPAPPSIPAQRQSFGFRDDPETGALVAQKPAFTGLGGSGGADSVGPADYVVKDAVLSSHKASTGTAFGASRTHRDLFGNLHPRKGEKAVPGPGRYGTRARGGCQREREADQTEADEATLRKRITAQCSII